MQCSQNLIGAKLQLRKIGSLGTWAWIIFWVIPVLTLVTLAEAKMPTAKWNGVVLAESNDFVVVEGNKYFPLSSLKMEYFSKSNHTTSCPWKGLANYFDVNVDGKSNPNAAWYYPNPKSEAANIKDRVAFWKGVQVS